MSNPNVEMAPTVRRRVFVSLVVILLGLGALVVLFSLRPQDVFISPEVQIGIIVVFAVGILIALLYLFAVGFASIDLAHKDLPLGLPDGSVRSLIALILIVVFVMLSIHVFQTTSGRVAGQLRGLNSQQVLGLGSRAIDVQQSRTATGAYDVVIRSEISETAGQMGSQLVAVLATLVTAVSAFYFGASTSASARGRVFDGATPAGAATQTAGAATGTPPGAPARTPGSAGTNADAAGTTARADDAPASAVRPDAATGSRLVVVPGPGGESTASSSTTERDAGGPKTDS